MFRLYETGLIIKNYGLQESLLISEIKGIAFDIVMSNFVLVFVFIIYYILYKINRKAADITFLVFFILTGVLHMIIVKYFLYQLIPLDIFLYQYSLKEILFTIQTSKTGYTSLLFGILLIIGTTFFSYIYLIRKQVSKKFIIAVYAVVIFSLPLLVFVNIYDIFLLNKFSRNKSVYFYKRTISYLLDSKNNIETYSVQDAKVFRLSYNNNKNVDPEYPLLHEFEKTDILGSLLDITDTNPPNLVILIVEGLSNDFIHPLKGIILMPFLNKLKDKSLYWDRCFTLGERSFAVVPSILGGLPYGVKGFTLLQHLPYHYSLVSVLRSNGYYTSFFYGQGSWFHQKDRFFKHNHIDLIFDNNKFSSKYEKIIVGKDNFFWGYNDKDLFNQSLEVLDTLPWEKRFDIYFTGSSHSPFIISDEEYYNKMLSKYIEDLQDENDKEFYTNYIKYLQTVLFVNDAIKDFFNHYEKRPEYSNTIFIITGDHPMTEVPINNLQKKYIVPLLLYSPKLIKPKTFHNIVSHLDIYETILAFLATNYQIDVPPISSSLGSKLDTSVVSDKRNIAFMNDNREIIDLYSNGYFLSNEQTLYKIEDSPVPVKIDNLAIRKQLIDKLEIFKKTNLYVCLNDKIISDRIYCKYLGFEIISSITEPESIHFVSEYHNIINKIPYPNKTGFYNISFNYHGEINENITFVYQLSNAHDSIVFWKNCGLPDKQYFLQLHTNIPKPNIPDDTLYFQSFFWNRNKQKMEYSNLRTLLYTE